MRGKFNGAVVNRSLGGAATAYLFAIDFAARCRSNAMRDTGARLYKIDHLSLGVTAFDCCRRRFVLVASRSTHRKDAFPPARETAMPSHSKHRSCRKPNRLVSVVESGDALPMRDVCRLTWMAQSRVSLEVPDRYVAAICIRVRPDCLLRGYSVGESCRLSVLRRK